MFNRRPHRRSEARKKQARNKLRSSLKRKRLHHECLEDRRLLAVATTGGAAALPDLGFFLPDSALSDINDVIQDATGSEALFYGALPGEVNDVKISGGYLDLVLMVDDDDQVPVLRTPPLFNRALLESFSAGVGIEAGLGLEGGLAVGINGEVGIGWPNAIDASLTVGADLSLALTAGAELSAGFGVDIPLIEILGGIPDAEAIAPNPAALIDIVDQLGPFVDVLRPVVDFVGGFSSGTISIPDLTIPGMELPSFFSDAVTGALGGVTIPLGFDAIGTFDNILSSEVTIPGFDIPVGTGVGDLVNVVPGLDFITSFVDFFDAIVGSSVGVTVSVGDRDDNVDLTATRVNSLVIGGEGNDRLLAGPSDETEFQGDDGNDILVVSREGNGNAIEFDGGGGLDTLIIPGTASDEIVYLEANSNGELVRYERRDPDGNVLASTDFDLTSVEQIQIFSDAADEELGGIGDDQLIIDGKLDYEGGVVFFGGDGIDSIEAIDDSGNFEVPQLYDDGFGNFLIDGGLIQFVDVEDGITLNADGNSGNVSFEGDDVADEIRFTGNAAGEATVVVSGQVPFDLVGFSNGTDVEITGALGDDEFFIALNDTTEFDLMLSGSGPVGGSSLIIEGTDADDQFEFTPDATDAQKGNVQFNGVDIDFEVINAITFVGIGGNDEMEIKEGAGTFDDTIYYSPTIVNDGSLIWTRDDTTVYPQISFTSIETRKIDSGSGSDSLILIGDEQPGINGDATISGAAGTATIDFDGHGLEFERTDGGDLIAIELDSFLDEINVTALPDADIAVNTGINDADALNLTATADVEIHSDRSTISQPGFGDITYAGIGQINIDAGGNQVEVDLSAGPDRATAIPLGVDSGRLELADGLGIDFSGASKFEVDGDGGGDVLTVLGSAEDDLLAIDGDSVAATGKLPIDFSEFVSLAVDGLEGIDQYRVIPDAIHSDFHQRWRTDRRNDQQSCLSG